MTAKDILNMPKPAELLQEVSKLINAGGLNKDVIDLLQVKVGLLTEDVERLEKENEKLRRELGKLQKETQPRPPQAVDPTREFDDDTRKILKAMFDDGCGVSKEGIADQFKLQRSVVDYHFDLLHKAKFIVQVGVGFVSYSTGRGHPHKFGLRPAGRSYVIKNKL